MELLEAPDNILAIRISHKITGNLLETIMDRLEQIMAGHEKVHVFVEAQTIDSIELSGFPAYVSRALPLFRKLRRFDRVAVVADQRWIRTGSRIESAMLPFISYRVFTPAERDAAFAWVTGR